MRRRSAALVILLVLVWGGTARAQNEECAACHEPRVGDLAASAHGGLSCGACHEGAAAHAGEPSTSAGVRFDLELCSGCHPDQYGTYVYGDEWKTTYGGSPYLWNKLNDFANYNDIIDGYGFSREYNEERSHNVMLEDHHDITRGKYETCLQCKSTKVAYYWDSGKEVVIKNGTFVHAGHMAQGITVPEGTTISMSTNRLTPYPFTHEVQVLVTLPDGTKYASFDTPGASRNPQWLWAALYALTVNELSPASPTRLSGNGCNHCHDPHKVGRDPASGKLVGFRLIRKSLVEAIDRSGINPYDPASPRVFDGDTPLTLDEGIALCAQCHVEYVCGNSPIDGIDRDYFPWAKAADLESVYSSEFPGYGPHAGRSYIQDWVHGTGGLSSPNAPGNGVTYLDPHPIREELIKSQHPEAETYWGSRHYGNEAECFVCHMPKVTRTGDGTQFTSHWLASPIKYMSPAPAGAFAAGFGLELTNEGIISPCGTCHGGKLSRMKDKAERIQDDTYADALAVQNALVDSLAAIEAAKDAQEAGQMVDPALLEAAADDHRAAHVRWENLVVSENSMGFHNPSEVSSELSTALGLAQSARQQALDALPAGCVDDTTPPVLSGTVLPSLLWPPNHRMVDVSAALGASDDCTAAASIVTILSGVACNEPDDAPGLQDGATPGDLRDAQLGTADFLVRLRAERDATGAGRTYTLTYTATDAAGNAASLPLTVFVPDMVGGQFDPLDIEVTTGPGGTLVQWPAVAGASHYNVIRGNLENVIVTTDAYDLGPVVCIEAASADTGTPGNEDAVDPPPGGIFFYLVEYDDGSRSGYGTEGAAMPRLTASGDCF